MSRLLLFAALLPLGVTGSAPVAPDQPQANSSLPQANVSQPHTFVLKSVPATPQAVNASLAQNVTRVNASTTDTQPAASRAAAEAKGLGVSCLPSDNCSAANSSCISGVCSCVANFTVSDTKSVCLAVAKTLGDVCQEDVQCYGVAADVGQGICHLNQCTCPESSILMGSKCIPKQTLGTKCNSSSECGHVKLATCLQNVCACPSDLIPSPENNKCLPVPAKMTNESCEFDLQCKSGFGDHSRCLKNRCICLEEYYYNGTKCDLSKSLGAVCQKAGDCFVNTMVEENGLRTCFNHTCACDIRALEDKARQICVKGDADMLSISIAFIFSIMIARCFL